MKLYDKQGHMMQARNLYIKTSRDPDLSIPYPPRRGRSREENGRPRNGIYLQSFQKFEIKRYIRNGIVLGVFRYPRFDRTFSSPMVNDYNQNLAGGWYWQYREDGSLRGNREFNNETILERLIAGRKPLGGFLFWDDAREKKENFLQQLVRSDLRYVSTTEQDAEFFTVSRRGKLGDLFNFEDIVRDYADLERGAGCNTLGPRVDLERFLGAAAEKCLESYLGFDHLHPTSTFDFIIIGLILGYPLENTYAILLKKQAGGRQ